MNFQKSPTSFHGDQHQKLLEQNKLSKCNNYAGSWSVLKCLLFDNLEPVASSNVFAPLGSHVKENEKKKKRLKRYAVSSNRDTSSLAQFWHLVVMYVYLNSSILLFPATFYHMHILM